MPYFDHAATTPMRSSAIEAMLPWLRHTGNPSGSHVAAQQARQAIDEARDLVAELLGAQPREIVFTGGGTEADNLAIRGVHARRGGRVLASAIEHHAVLEVIDALRGERIPVTDDGILDLVALGDQLADDVSVVSVMTANNEVGSIQPIAKVSRLMEKRAPRAVLHTDAVQAVAWLDVADATRFAHLVSISAHKFGGPQGVGALVVREGVELDAQQLGGGQERERRSGTQNVAGIVAMAAALRECTAERTEATARVAGLRDRLVDGLLSALPDARETVPRERKTVNNAHLLIPSIESESLLILLDDSGVCASSGASCASGALEPSHVLLAMGHDETTANRGLRLTLGATTTEADIDAALSAIPAAVARLAPSRSGVFA